jgi:hypothetical protein
LQRFCDRLTGESTAPASQLSRARQREIAQAEKELTDAGI